MSNNPGLKWVDVNRQKIKTYAVRNCGLIGEHALHYFDVGAGWSVADTIDVSGNPNLKPKMSYYKGSCPNLRYVDLTGCNIQNDIVFYGDGLRQDLQLKVGVPQRLKGTKTRVVWERREGYSDMNIATWWKKADEWRKYTENAHTVVFYYAEIPFIPEIQDELEEITQEDLTLRRALGEEGYNIWKKKYAPNGRVLHTSDLASVTDVELTGFKVNNIDSVTMYIPKTKRLVIDGDYKVIRLSGVNDIKYLRIENNSVLDTLSLKPNKPYLNKYLDEVEIRNTNLASYHFTELGVSQVYPKRIVLNNVGGVPGYDYMNLVNPSQEAIHVNGAKLDVRINGGMLSGKCDTLALSNIKALYLTGESNVSNNVSIPYVALSDSFRVIGGNARISNAYVTNWTNPTSASLEALAKSVGGKLFINGMSGEGEPIQLNSSTTKASELRIQNANREVRLTGGAGQNFALYVTDASVGFSENFMAGAMNMPNISVSGISKLTFMSADALLKWLYVWKPQNPGANVTMAVATDDPSKQSVAAMVNAAIAGGMVDVDKMSKQTVLTNINNFVNNGTIPAGDAYKDVLKEVAGDLFQSLYTPAGEYSVRLTIAPKNTVVYTVLREVLDCTLAEAREYQATAPCDLVSGITQNAAIGIKNDLDAKFNAKGIDVVVEVVKGTTSSGAGTTETTGATDTTGTTTGTTTDATAGTTTDTTTDANAGTTSDTADVPSRVTTITRPSTTTRTLVSYTYNVGLANIGASKLAVIKVVKEQLGLTLSNAKTLVESAPCVLATGVTKAQADSLKALLEEAGATVVLNAISSSGTTSTSVTTPTRISL